ncbi:hypothetical protein BDD12DRAFT_829902 [Trichophaea hybrida]|nr:hypothetical protein BDD12DRAFT_829902 [Trichophaea hybrida]
MATPRSLRSFLDATPSDILDTPFQSLIFLPRVEHDGLLSQIAILHGELADKQSVIDDLMLQGGEKYDNDDKPGKFLASIEAEVQRGRVSCLEQEKANIEREKQDLVASVEEADAKSRALKSEVVKLRNQLQQSQQKTQQLQQQLQQRESVTVDGGIQAKAEEKRREDETRWDIEKVTLEHRNNELKSENDRLKVQLKEAEKGLHDLRDIVPSAKELSFNYKTLQAENDTLIEDRRSLQESLCTITERNSQLFEATKNLESQGATLRKANQELMASLARHEEENKTLFSKNHDLADENAKLEKEGYKMQKEKIGLETSNEALTESKTALSSELKALQEKLSETQDPHGDERYRQDLRNRAEGLREEKAKMGDELRRMEIELRRMRDDLRQREDLIADMRRNDRELRGERADLLREIRELKETKNSVLDENDDLRKKCAQLQKDLQILQTRLTAAKRTTEKPAGDKTLNPNNPQSASTDKSMTSSPDLPNEPPKGPRAQTASELPRGPKRKTFDSPRSQPNHDPRFAQPATPDNPEKRQRLDQAPSPSTATTFKRRGAVYLVELPRPINYSGLHAALIEKLCAEIDGLRRVFYAPVAHKEQWVVKFTGPPKAFVKHVYVMPGVIATLIACSGTTCLICSDKDHRQHDIWECPYLRQEGQDRPTLKQLEMNYRSPPLGSVVDAMPPKPPPPVGEQSPRSLFERVSFPDGRHPPRRALTNQGNQSQTSPILSILSVDNIRSNETRLLNLSHKERRSLFYRFTGSYVPKEHQLISIINFGPIESVDIIPDSRVGFIDFVYPDHAKLFLEHAIANINGKVKFYDSHPGSSGFGTVVFRWSDTAVKPLEPFLVKGIVAEGWTRVLTLEQVPKGLTVERIRSHAQGDGTNQKLGFWISEDEPYPGSDGTRDVRIEFRSIKEAEKAYKNLVLEGYPQSGLTFSPEQNTVRPAPMQ